MIVLQQHFFLELLKLLFYSTDEYSISSSLILLLLVVLCIFPKNNLEYPSARLLVPNFQKFRGMKLGSYWVLNETRTKIAVGSDGFKRMNSPCLCKWHSKSSRLNINWKVKVWNFQSSIIQTIKNVKINILCLFFSKLFMVPSLGNFTFIKIFAYTVTLQSIHVNDCVSDDNQNSHFPDT